MDTTAKAGVLFTLAQWVKYMRVFIDQRITIGRPKQAADLIAAFEGCPIKFHVFIDIAGEHMQRWVVADDFFDQCLRDVTVACFQQGFGAVAKGVNRRLVTRVEQQNAGCDQLVVRQLIASLVCRDQG